MTKTVEPVQFHYLVVLANGQEYYFWAENEHHALDQAIDAEPDNPVILIKECEHECPDLRQDDWTDEK
jgi:predicted amidohydrolase YtcJ